MLNLFLLGCATPWVGGWSSGDTTVVAFVNPVVNEGSAWESRTGEATRASVSVETEPGGAGFSNDDGIVVLPGESGTTKLHVGGNLVMLGLSGGAVYDVPFAWDGNRVDLWPGMPLRWAPGDGAVAELRPPAAGTEIDDALAAQKGTVILAPGIYFGDVHLSGDGLAVLGDVSRGDQVIIDGSVIVEGDGARLRGVTITGDLVLWNDDTVVAMTVVQGETRILGSKATMLGNVFCGTTIIDGGEPLLLANHGLAPLPERPSGACPLQVSSINELSGL